MGYEQIIVDEPAERVARVTLNRPEKRNATTKQMAEELTHAFDEVRGRADVHVVILRGAGKAFCSGHDLNEVPITAPYAVPDPWMAEQQSVFDDIAFHRRLLWELPQPVIAQVHGHCLTTGLELAMNCDLVYVSDDLKLGVRLAGGAARYIHLWPWLIGVRRTKELLYTGRYISGQEAVELGMVNASVPLEELDDLVLGIARQIGQVPLEFLAIDKQATNKVFDLMGVREGVEYSAMLHATGHRTQPGLEQADGLYGSDNWRKGVEARDAHYENE